MLCKKVLPLLSEFFDEALDADTAVRVSQHLSGCLSCRRELDAIADLHASLRSLGRAPAPEYLRSLVQHRLSQQPWHAFLRNELERYWSIIRTTEAMWYATRALGTLMATLFILIMSSAITPFYVGATSQISTRATFNPAYSSEARASIAKKFGMVNSEIPRQPAAIHDLWLLEYGDKAGTAEGKEDNLAVMATIDRSGTAKVERVIERPSDGNLLASFSQLIGSARFRPASENGQAVSSPIVFTFTRILVSY